MPNVLPDHPRYCPQSGGPGRIVNFQTWVCPRCGRMVHVHNGILVPHVRFRAQEFSIELMLNVAPRAGCHYIVKPWGHEGRAADGSWTLVDTMHPDHTIRSMREDVKRDVFSTFAEAVTEQDRLNGWTPLQDHVAEVHGRWFDTPMIGTIDAYHNAYHDAYENAHEHRGDAVVRLAPVEA